MSSVPRMGQTDRKHGYEAGTQCSVPFSKQLPDAGLCRQDSDCSEGTYNRQGQGTVVHLLLWCSILGEGPTEAGPAFLFQVMAELQKPFLTKLFKAIGCFPQTDSFLAANWPQLIVLFVKRPQRTDYVVLWISLAELELQSDPINPSIKLSSPVFRDVSSYLYPTGLMTGKCVNYNSSMKTCEIFGWCPAEVDYHVPK